MFERRDWSKVGEIVSKMREPGLSIKDGTEQFDVEAGLLYEYNPLQKKAAADGTGVQPAGGGRTEVAAGPMSGGGVRLPEKVQELIRAYRQDHPAHEFKRIADLLNQRHLVVVSRKQIRSVLKAPGPLKICESSFDREETGAKGTRRFEAQSAAEMWQTDVVYIRKGSVLSLVLIVDDHSRYCVAAELCTDQRAETLPTILHNASTEHGAPKKLLPDQGSDFYTWSGEQTRFQEYLDDQRIERFGAEPHSPQTRGMVEWLIQTIRTQLLTRVKFVDFADARDRIRP